MANLVQVYYQSAGNQAGLYNAPLHDLYPFSFNEGSPYFLTDSFTIGNVSYDGLIYQQVSLLYDMVKDEIIVRHPNRFPLALIKDKTDSFSFAGHAFIKFKEPNEAGAASENFYEQLYSGHIKLLAKKRKLIEESTEGPSVIRKIRSRTQYYILRDGDLWATKNKNTLLSLLKDKRNELQQFIKSNDLRFKENFEEDMVKTVAYYDQLM